jgi:hypothetical protein
VLHLICVSAKQTTSGRKPLASVRYRWVLALALVECGGHIDGSGVSGSVTAGGERGGSQSSGSAIGATNSDAQCSQGGLGASSGSASADSTGGIGGGGGNSGPTSASRGSCDGSRRVMKLASASPSYPNQVAVDATSLYWIAGGNLQKVAVGGGTPITLASGPSAAVAMAIDPTSVYWTAGDAVLKVPLGGGTPSTLATGQSSPQGIAVDAANVSWANSGTNDDGSVMKMPLCGGTPVALAVARNGPWAIALAAGSAVWAEQGTVWKIGLNGGTPTALASTPGLTAMAVDRPEEHRRVERALAHRNRAGRGVVVLDDALFRGRPYRRRHDHARRRRWQYALHHRLGSPRLRDRGGRNEHLLGDRKRFDENQPKLDNELKASRKPKPAAPGKRHSPQPQRHRIAGNRRSPRPCFDWIAGKGRSPQPRGVDVR